MSEDSVISAKFRILDLFCELNDFELDTIEQWICSHSYKKGAHFNLKTSFVFILPLSYLAQKPTSMKHILLVNMLHSFYCRLYWLLIIR